MLVKSQVKYIQSLSQKKSRDEEGVFIAEGPKLINELLSTPNVQLKQLYAVPEWISQHPQMQTGSVVEVKEQELERLSFLQTPNQVVGVFRKPVFPKITSYRGQLSLMLDAIQDPGNLGTIIRCADWFGINTVICSPESADVFSPKVVQSTMGSISRVQVIYEDLVPFMEQHAGIPAYAATLHGTSLYDLQPLQQGILVIGNESKGIREELLKLCRHRITIPRKGEAESLNAAVATGIILSHIVR
ncbi:RNA methyltransferase [Paraflavitalea soli]|uniref:RNA methyltransferase n=1 Tax=Paraflavitalea soli TaxID=2315862 RepID=A0A3B7MUS5_9BACT|nr:RNA methyltransferase [Paraflavitalea soli]AXY78282.1 RNA methyltransferase [Paraflavitalea soli]